MRFITRFAPSPTGPLHLGHAYSACLAHDMARAARGQFLLRIDDIDQSRSRPEWVTKIIDDLGWLGLSWDTEPWVQSSHFDVYEAAIDDLIARGLVYPCSCSRADIAAAASAPQEGAPAFGPDGRIYPGTCRGRAMGTRKPADALRLDLARAMPATLRGYAESGPTHSGHHVSTANTLLQQVGDPVLARPHMVASYHLSVVLDDAAQNVTHVVRGEDLFEATALQVLLQQLLDLPTPLYHHHALIRDEAGRRLAKRDDARAISKFREEGATPDDVRKVVGLPARAV